VSAEWAGRVALKKRTAVVRTLGAILIRGSVPMIIHCDDYSAYGVPDAAGHADAVTDAVTGVVVDAKSARLLTVRRAY
jgi:hypothetical protein